ncbi:2,4-dienoyl-CoA reductase-like NADH-dependent reductase (Old Yellow Enzyme family) [Microbacterium endophyticum]|uniref:2,4-dienoyl-CoA reductase-like NADH-dependent reductase (Old Yellow Enzyme family) n=1 Tax=Microbacterium endophyticum TaxID=1526412 RepID=A0A7W4V0L8_9MICO|nr:NADH:flavin oxidoreductase/NADH oxidase [Microbacterium endophyticum]MBB2974670.1 2,4-dienoyl-CoA reductase-like NADH-dependent reductase (Old Yellow Enzyme family) [Microbacterium endophyticum]NIK36967.1 2,4-dienoyl-CoA reductase-like NADH-dependent reductase (Old Yellow Enzyme family) [Microbacterium endophyticum]
MSLLFSPLAVRNVTFKNRLWVAPMCQYSAEDGVVNDWHHVHLSQFASGGAGLIVTEAAAVVPEGRISPRDAGIWNDTQRDAWATITESIHARGSLAGIQLAHAGRKASTWWPFSGQSGSVSEVEGGWETLGPSPIAYEGFHAPREMTAAQIIATVEAFRLAARRSITAGFDVIELHAAHGYLLHEFLSPLSNTRTDAWGGSLENQARLLLDLVRAVRDEIGPKVPLFVRFSATDAAPGGLTTDDVATVARWTIEAGADLSDVSTAGLVAHQKITVGPGYQVAHAARVREVSAALTAAVGIITSGPQAEGILQAGDADAIFAGREFLRDPHFALRAASELGEDPETIWPPQYIRAYRSVPR